MSQQQICGRKDGEGRLHGQREKKIYNIYIYIYIFCLINHIIFYIKKNKNCRYLLLSDSLNPHLAFLHQRRLLVERPLHLRNQVLLAVGQHLLYLSESHVHRLLRGAPRVRRGLVHITNQLQGLLHDNGLGGGDGWCGRGGGSYQGDGGRGRGYGGLECVDSDGGAGGSRGGGSTSGSAVLLRFPEKREREMNKREMDRREIDKINICI